MSQWVVFHVTERCAEHCAHCLRDPARQPVELSLPVVEKVLDEAAALHGIHHVGFTGGEPLLWPPLSGALDAVARRGATWHIVTSGRGFGRLLDLLDERPARRAGLTTVGISVDGATEEVHDSIRGEGSYRAAMAAIAACSARGLPFAVRPTLHARNAHELEQLALEGAALGAKEVSFSMTHATGSASDRDLYLSPAALDAIRDRVVRLSTVLQLPVTLSEGFRRGWRFHVCEPFRSEILHVTADGMLNLCCNHSGVPGGREDVVADLAVESLANGHRKLLSLIDRLQRERLDQLAAAPATPGWDDFPCNRCLSRLGKPHWVDGGSAGPRARRSLPVAG
jgi:MoaA/NifB/PqqE/SkfB family radical SAM enzyme